MIQAINLSKATATSPLYGDALRVIREAKGLTVKDAASACGMQVVTWAKLESGRQLPQHRTVTRIEEGLSLGRDERYALFEARRKAEREVEQGKLRLMVLDTKERQYLRLTCGMPY